jgi:hypothetical protein
MWLATDQRFPGPLWKLLITHDASGFHEQFTLNSQAEAGPNPALTDSDGNPISEGAVDSRVRSAFVITSSTTATLNPLDLFPSGTVYHVSQTIEYESGTASGFTLAPEPSSLALMVLGLTGLGAGPCCTGGESN